MNAGRTAIRRRNLSAPMKWLHEHCLIKGKALDFGCGHGYDADCLDMVGYDPFHRPSLHALMSTYETVTCNYVLNVIKSPEERNDVIKTLLRLTRHDGMCYLSIRRDKENLKGITKSGTWQGWVELDSSWETLIRKRSFQIFSRRM